MNPLDEAATGDHSIEEGGEEVRWTDDSIRWEGGLRVGGEREGEGADGEDGESSDGEDEEGCMFDPFK